MKIPSVCSIELNFYRYTFCIKKHYLNWSMVLTLLQHRWKYVFYKSKEYDWPGHFAFKTSSWQQRTSRSDKFGVNQQRTIYVSLLSFWNWLWNHNSTNMYGMNSSQILFGKMTCLIICYLVNHHRTISGSCMFKKYFEPQNSVLTTLKFSD